MRFCDAAAGHIYMDGKDYHSMKPEELRKHIAMVPQQVNLFPGPSVKICSLLTRMQMTRL